MSWASQQNRFLSQCTRALHRVLLGCGASLTLVFLLKPYYYYDVFQWKEKHCMEKPVVYQSFPKHLDRQFIFKLILIFIVNIYSDHYNIYYVLWLEPAFTFKYNIWFSDELPIDFKHLLTLTQNLTFYVFTTIGWGSVCILKLSL